MPVGSSTSELFLVNFLKKTFSASAQSEGQPSGTYVGATPTTTVCKSFTVPYLRSPKRS
jgi:hypothetical protein